MLAENASGEPMVYDSPPWIEEHRWLFEENLEASRVSRKPGAGREEAESEGPEDEALLGEDGFLGEETLLQEEEESDEAPDEGEKNLSRFYWGLSATLDRTRGRSLDARRFLTRPGEPEGEEEEIVEEEETSIEEDDETDSEERRKEEER